MFAHRSIDTLSVDHEDIKGIERQYELLGITGVEDLLQDNVRSCIQDFIEAGMKVWMLTGDKGETARNIATNCGIIDESMEVF